MPIKIFIDQGHNPHNPNAGAEANGVREQDINFEVGIRLAALLNSNPEFTARTSRQNSTEMIGTSTNTSLAARVNAANSWGADYFISLHCNASIDPNISGSEAFAYSRTSEGYALGEKILVGLNYATGLENRGVAARPSLYVLRKTNMPSVLVEMGFVTNSNDAYLLSTNPQLFATGIYNGILLFFGLL